jgi:hypothetical protein
MRPGCNGAAARLPKKPGIQKLTPPSSAREGADADTSVTVASAAVAAIEHLDRLRTSALPAGAERLPFIVASLEFRLQCTAFESGGYANRDKCCEAVGLLLTVT